MSPSTPITSLALWLDELAKRHPPDVMKFGLQSMQKGIAILGIQPPELVITVAGTNGKGSVVAQIAHLIQQTGTPIAVYTSPHVYDFRERATLSGTMFSEKQWVEAFTCIDCALGDNQLTFFEWVTLAAFLLFQQTQAPVWLLEIGLGGRLDAVNAIDNQFNIITNIDFDHTDRLGHTLDAIAYEKAGVMRKDVITVSAATLPIMRQLAKDYGARISMVGDSWHYSHTQQHIKLTIDNQIVHSPIPQGIVPINTALALVSAWHIQSQYSRLFRKPLVHIGCKNQRSLAHVCVPGRREERIIHNVRCVLDVAHNCSGIKALAQYFNQHYPHTPTLAIFGCLIDKHPLKNMQQYFQQVHTWLIADIPGARGQSAKQLISTLDIKGTVIVAPLCHYTTTHIRAKIADGVLLGFGSFHIPPLVQKLMQNV